jgi:hypothetical protein
LNKRIPEASALREFFDAQLTHLQQLLVVRQSIKHQQQSETKRLSIAVDTIVQGTDSRLRAIGNYQKRLRRSAHDLIDHIESLVADLPPAVKVSQATYYNNSLVNTLFPGTKAMHRLFSQSIPVRDFFNSPEHRQLQEVFALLLASRTEKHILGAEVCGEVILREVQQTTVCFSDHQLIDPQVTEENARLALKKYLFDSVIRQLKTRITRLRYRQTQEEKMAAMQNPQFNIDNPEVYIEMLIEQLSLPKRLLTLQDKQLRLSKVGIKLPLDSQYPSNKVTLHEVEIEGEQSRVVTLVRYPRQELHKPQAPFFL